MTPKQLLDEVAVLGVGYPWEAMDEAGNVGLQWECGRGDLYIDFGYDGIAYYTMTDYRESSMGEDRDGQIKDLEDARMVLLDYKEIENDKE